MTVLEVPDQGAAQLHIWQKPAERRGDRPVARSSVTIADTTGQRVLDCEPTDDYLLSEAAITGPARIEWNAAETDISLAYAFVPETVAETGIVVLFTTAANAPAIRRYLCHLKPPFGWMNDPNGMCFRAGRLNVFYQHYPHARRWNTMHWGHAESPNLVDWCHYPVFLNPRAELLKDKAASGGAFSGSAVPQPDGSLAVYYTDRQDDRLPNWEWQMRTTSADWISTGPSMPIITDRPPHQTAVRDNRDAYVFHDPDGGWKLLLGGGDGEGGVIYIYETDDAAGAGGWRYAGPLYRDAMTEPMPLECPSLVALDGAGLYVLTFGIIGFRDPATRRRHLSFGVVGRLDGNRFIAEQRFELDFGTDAYAFQAIAAPGGPLALAWGANWADVFKSKDFPSAMILPRRLRFDGSRLLTPPHEAVNALRCGLLAEGTATTAKTLPLPEGLGDLEVGGLAGRPFRLGLDHPDHRLAVTYDGETLELVFEAPDGRPRPRYLRRTGPIGSLRLIVDVGLIELYVDGGAHCCTKRIDSDLPVSSLSLEVDGAPEVRFALHRLRPSRNSVTYGPAAGVASYREE